MSILKDMFYRNNHIGRTDIDYDIYIPFGVTESWIRLYRFKHPDIYGDTFTEDVFSDIIVHNCIKYAFDEVITDLKSLTREFLNHSSYIDLCKNVLNWYNYYSCTGNTQIVIVNFIRNSCLHFRVQTLLGEVKVGITFQLSPNFEYPGNQIDNFKLAMLIRQKFKERFAEEVIDHFIPFILKYEENRLRQERREEERRQMLEAKKLEEERIRKEQEEKLQNHLNQQAKNLHAALEEKSLYQRRNERMKASLQKRNAENAVEEGYRKAYYDTMSIDFYKDYSEHDMLTGYLTPKVTWYNTGKQNKVMESATVYWSIDHTLNKACIKRILELCQESLIEEAKEIFINSIPYKRMFKDDKTMINMFKMRIDISDDSLLLFTFRFKDELINIFKDMTELDFLVHPKDMK